MVILGDPGSGKTVLAEELGKLPGIKYVPAGSFIRKQTSSLFAEDIECVVIDGIDEIPSTRYDNAVDKVLTKLSIASNPRFILTCRAADWKGSADSVKIKDDYGEEPRVLYLEPFTYEDAHCFLSREFPDIDTKITLEQFSTQEVGDIYGNPLTLRLFSEIVKKGGTLPDSRAELLAQACQIMLTEENLHHHGRLHTSFDHEDILNAAGAICLTVVLCNYSGVCTGAYGTTPSGFAHSEDIAKLPFGRLQEYALKTRLFEVQGENCFVPCHRVIAEYLGARWLAKCCENNLSTRRILNLFHHNSEIPTSLRGLHAWTVHFSDRLAESCIVADPIGILKNGVAEHLQLDQARILLSTLKESLAEDSCSILDENWPQFIHRASGLMHTQLRNEIRAIIEKPGQHFYLTVILLRSMVGRVIVTDFAPVLTGIILDRDRTYAERYYAAKAINSATILDTWETVLQDLLKMKDSHSARLSYEIILLAGASTLTIETATETLLSYSGLEHNIESNTPPFPSSLLFRDLETSELPSLLDSIASRTRPIIAQIDDSEPLLADSNPRTEDQSHLDQGRRIYNARSFIADIVRRLTIRVLETDQKIPPEHLWSWVGWLKEHEGYDKDATERVAKLVCNNQELRSAIIEQVLFVSGADESVETILRQVGVHGCLKPTQEEIAGLLRAWLKREEADQLNPGLWRLLLRIGLSDTGSKNIVYETAHKIASDVPELLTILDEESKRIEDLRSQRIEDQIRQEERQNLELKNLREQLYTLEADLVSGDIKALSMPSAIYLGKSSYSVPSFNLSGLTPERRLRSTLGGVVAEKAMIGFMAVLKCNNLPKVPEIVNLYCQGREHEAESSMICGVAEMLRRGIAIDPINHDILLAVYAAWRRRLVYELKVHNDIGPALEEVLFSTEEEWEIYYRASIETELDRTNIIRDELNKLSTDTTLTKLAGRLAIDWLCKYTDLSPVTHKELIGCMLRHSEHTKSRVLVDRQLATFEKGSSGWLLWLSVAFMIDFDKHRETLEDAAAEHPRLLWFLKDRIHLDGSITENRGQSLHEFSLEQLAFIIRSFAECWPIVEEPTSCSGDKNPWDASNFIKKIISTIARVRSYEATEALQNLMASNLQNYDIEIRRAITLQVRNRHDLEGLTVGQLRAVITDNLPENIDDMRAWFSDRIKTVQAKIRGSKTDMWEAYWNNEMPRGENFCRNRLIEHISQNLPQSVRIEPESQMPMKNRADICLMLNQLKLPIEIKGQWNPNLWSAASDQLAAKYMCDWEACGCGVYIVLWFGIVPRKQLTRRPNTSITPQTPKDLKDMLIQDLPDKLTSRIDIFIIDVSKPSS